MLGLNHRVRNVPVISSTTNDHSAISPSMNDQWSGKTLRICFFDTVANPVRSSAQLAMAPRGFAFLTGAGVLAVVLTKSASFPEARPHRLREVAGGDEVALIVHSQGQL